MRNRATNVVCIETGTHRARVIDRRNELVEANLSLVEGIARRVARMVPQVFDLDDLIQTGNVALINAATRYRPAEHGGAPFAAYARPRVWGAMVDSIKRRHYIAATLGRLTMIREEDEPAIAPTAESDIDEARLSRRMREAVECLPPEERRILQLYYGAEEPSLAEVGARLKLTSSRTLRLHARAITALKDRLAA